MKIKLFTALRKSEGFSQVDLLVVLFILAILVALKLSCLAAPRQQGNWAVCQNNLRQFGAALLIYGAEDDGYFPGRIPPPNTWPVKLRPYYGDTKLLKCPGDATQVIATGEDAPKSYVYNVFNDYVYDHPELDRVYAFPEAVIPLPDQTIVFGEKVDMSAHSYMDLYQGDLDFVDRIHHFASTISERPGGSNYSFADGSVRYLRSGEDCSPEMLWAVVEEVRIAWGTPP